MRTLASFSKRGSVIKSTTASRVAGQGGKSSPLRTGRLLPAPQLALDSPRLRAQQRFGAPTLVLCKFSEGEESFRERGLGEFAASARRGQQLRLARLFQQLLGAEEGGEVARDAIECRWAGVPGAVLLGVLDLFPVGPNFVHVLHLGRA